MNDRQRIEALFFPLLFKSLLESAAKRDDGFYACKSALDAAMIDILKREDDRRKAQLMRRAIRAVDGFAKPERKGGVRADKIALQAYHLLQAVLVNGYLELDDGSMLAIAITAVLDAFADAFNEAKLDASARKHAAKALAELQSAGLFAGVEMRNAA